MSKERSQSELYAIKKAYEREGRSLCVSCGKEMPATETRWPRCAECKHTPVQRATKARARKKAQQLARAKKEPKWRERARRHNAKRLKAKRARWRALGLCLRCGRERLPGYGQCAQCIEQQKVRNAKARAAARASTAEMGCLWCPGRLTWLKSKERTIVAVPYVDGDAYIPMQKQIDFRDMVHDGEPCDEFRKRTIGGR
jgi:hypothetical protein